MPLSYLRVVISAILAAGSLSYVQGQSQAEEYRVKAAFLYHFAQLVDWPADALNAHDDSLRLCTYGENPVYAEFETSVAGKRIGSRVIRIRHVNQTDSIQGCHILFIGRDDSKRIATVLMRIGNAPVVTVGETDRFTEQGGIIGFCLENNKVRFDVNLAAAERAKIRISSRLLLLAKNVIGNSGAK